MNAPLPPHSPTSRLARITELLVRYGTCQRGNKVRILDRETGNVLPREYETEDLARAGARDQAACDIADLFDVKVGTVERWAVVFQPAGETRNGAWHFAFTAPFMTRDDAAATLPGSGYGGSTAVARLLIEAPR